MKLKREDAAWVQSLAAANDLPPEAVLQHLLHPEEGWKGGWQAGVTLHGGRFRSVRLGVQILHGKKPKVRGMTLLPRVTVPELPELGVLEIAGGCDLPEVADLTRVPAHTVSIHGQTVLRELRTGPHLQILDVKGNKRLEALDLTGSPRLSSLDLFETGGRITAWDIQLATVDSLGRLKGRCTLLPATADVLREAAGTALHREDGKVLGAVVQHPACPEDLALTIYWALAPGTFGPFRTATACPTAESKAAFKTLLAIEKRTDWSEAASLELHASHDLGAWARAPSAELATRAGIRLQGSLEPVTKPKKPAKPASKKPAKPSAAAEESAILARFVEWLEHPAELGRTPDSVEIVWRQQLPLGKEKVRTCLVHWKSGEHAFIGIAGPFEWSFMGLGMDRLEPLKKATRYRRLVNLYWGWWTCFLAAQQPGYAELPRLDARGLERAFLEETTSVDLRGNAITAGKELDPNVGVRSVPRERCTLRCLAEPEVYIDPRKVRHYAVAGAIDYQYPEGVLTAEYQLYFRADADGRIKRSSMRQLPLGVGGIYADLPLFHWVGSHTGPFLFGKQAWVSLFDH